jgi:hypothetical protein
MPFTLRQLPSDRKLATQLTLDIFAKTIPAAVIDHVLQQTQRTEQRHRRITMRAIVWLIIAMSIWRQCAIPTVYRHLTRGLRWIWPDAVPSIPSSSAFTYRRYQLGARPLHALFRQVCRPQAQPTTPGAFLFGLRLMAIDGTVENVPDTPANDHYFGRPGSRRGRGGYPQAKALYLVECGTHAIVDGGIWPCRTSERTVGQRLLRSVDASMLVLWDRGFHSHAMIAATQRRGAHILGRIASGVKPTVQEVLTDGSLLVTLAAPNHGRPTADPGIQLRLLNYQLSMPALGDPTLVHRLVTTLLDPLAYPARALICAYHERWEIEITIDELATHQRMGAPTFRSQKPVGVIQEFYGMLLAHYAIRGVMYDAATAVEVDPDRISFVLAVQEIQATIRDFQSTSTNDHPQLYDDLVQSCARPLVPPRHFRCMPRVVKQKMTKFLCKQPEHRPWPQPAGQFSMAICRITAAGDPICEPGGNPPVQWTHYPRATVPR